MSREFRVVPPAKSALVSLIALGGVLPAVILLAVRLDGNAGGGSDTAWAVLLIIALLALILLALILLALTRRKVCIEDGKLIVRAAMYTRTRDVADLAIENARIVDLRGSEFMPMLRMNGIGLPGMRIGHFRKGLFKRKMFCLLNRFEKVLVLPERQEDRFILLSMEHPETLLAALKKAGESKRAH